LPQGSDEFNAPTLNPQWQWNYQPRANGWSLTERPGYLRLHAFKPLQPGNFFKAGDTLELRHLRSDLTVATVKMDLSGMSDGQQAGLAHFNGGVNLAMLGVVQNAGVKTIQYEQDKKATSGDNLPSPTQDLWLRSTIAFDDIAHFAYSTDGKTFIPFGDPYKIRSGHYRGDMVGLYSFNNAADAGYVDIDYFHYDLKNKPDAPSP
jgi:beta-xylosidase